MKGHVLKGSHLLTFRNLAKSIRQASAVGFAEALTTRTATPSLGETGQDLAFSDNENRPRAGSSQN